MISDNTFRNRNGPEFKKTLIKTTETNNAPVLDTEDEKNQQAAIA